MLIERQQLDRLGAGAAAITWMTVACCCHLT
jgi:hypothetical protein